MVAGKDEDEDEDEEEDDGGAGVIGLSPSRRFPVTRVGCGIRPVSTGGRAGPGRILGPGEAGRGVDAPPGASVQPRDGRCGSEHPCSSLRLCVLLSPHRPVLSEGRMQEGPGEGRAEVGRLRRPEEERRGPSPLLPALANRSAAPLRAAAARCLRTDYAAFRDGSDSNRSRFVCCLALVFDLAPENVT